MKTPLIYFRKSFKRYQRMCDKRHARLKRLQEAVDYMDKWSDIPMSQLYSSLCETLNIKNNEAARDFLRSLNLGRPDLSEMAKKLPLL